MVNLVRSVLVERSTQLKEKIKLSLRLNIPSITLWLHYHAHSSVEVAFVISDGEMRLPPEVLIVFRVVLVEPDEVFGQLAHRFEVHRVDERVRRRETIMRPLQGQYDGHHIEVHHGEELLRHVIETQRVLQRQIKFVLGLHHAPTRGFLRSRTLQIAAIAVNVDADVLFQSLDESVAGRRRATIADKPSHHFRLSSRVIFHRLLFHGVLQHCRIGVQWQLSWWFDPAVWWNDVRVPSVRHGPVEKVTQEVRVNHSITRRFHAPENVALMRRSLSGQIVFPPTPQMKQNLWIEIHFILSGLIAKYFSTGQDNEHDQNQ